MKTINTQGVRSAWRPSYPFRRVVRTEDVTTKYCRQSEGCRWHYLECGHAVITKQSAGFPRKKRCRDCGLNAQRPASVLDACCGSRMFWFDRQDPRAVFADNRRETHVLRDKSSAGGSRMLTINPDVLADFTALPWPDDSFALVVFDPPHLLRAGRNGWQAKKYGKLEGDWRDMLRRGFSECFRVLRPEGTLIFKWNEHEIPVSQILELTPERPLVGQRCGKTARTHWMVFMKQNQ